MANKEVVVSHKDIQDPQKITRVVEDAFKEQAGCDAHKNDCVDLVDDFSTGRRIYKLKKVKFFGPWSHRG
jgi:hypothetical protein